jgi:hypothetical protein
MTASGVTSTILIRLGTDHSLQPKHLVETRDIAPNASDPTSDLFHGGIKFGLPTTRDKDMRSLRDKAFGRARPGPLVPPVTSATFSASFFVSMSCFVVSVSSALRA